MSHFILALLLAEVVSMVAVGVATRGHALEGFGIAALTWAVIWTFGVMLVQYYIAMRNDMVTAAPVTSFLIGVANGLVFYAAFRIEQRFERRRSLRTA